MRLIVSLYAAALAMAAAIGIAIARIALILQAAG